MTEHNDAGDGVGEELARARAALGFSVADVAQQLKFAARQIEALEQGRFEQLPAGTFARGMVRAYARLLKLDPEPLVQRVAGRVAVPDNTAAVTSASVRRPIPITDNARRTNLIYAALSIGILVVIAVVVFEWQREQSVAAGMRFVPAAAEAPKPANPAPLVASSSTSVTAALASPEPAPVPAAPAAAPATAPAAALIASQSASPTATAGGVRRLSLKFDKESWIEIRGRGGKLLASQLNPGGSEQTIEGMPPFSLIIGNAQHVRLSYDDKPVDLVPHVKVEVARFTLD